MCGIFGYVLSATGVTSEVFLENAIKFNNYRGTDKLNYTKHSGDNLITLLGHSRLTITGTISSGSQPIVTSSHILVYNGEIFNFENVHSGGICDTNLLSSLLDDGVDSKKLNSLNGFFAFAIFYPEQKELFLVRDRFGEKPLYFVDHPLGLFFSSSALPLCLNQQNLVKPISEESGGGILFDEVNPTSNICQVPPGHLLRFCNGKSIIHRWYYPNLSKFSVCSSFSEAVKNYDSLLYDAVKIRIKDQDRIAISLSGGIDSTLVADTINNVRSTPFHAFTFSTNEKTYNEVDSALMIASKIGIPLTVIKESTYDQNEHK